MVLDEILTHKRIEVARRKAGTSFESLLARCEPSARGFEATLRRRRPGFILEIKCASPSAGVIRAGTDLEPVLSSYGRHADAISVLTDDRFFGGSLARLAEVRARLSQPLLCKDFILEPYQVAEARAHGADAILLILAAIDGATWRACAGLAERLGMDVLTEAHDEAEIGCAVALGARMIGVNNRDLRTLRVDIGTTPRLAPAVPADRLVVAESGIASHEDVAALRPHADAFLVGSALMREPDLDLAVRRLVQGTTKVCGLTRPHDARAALDAGATHGGLVFAKGSPREVTLSRAEAVREGAPLAWVGVFVNEAAGAVAGLAERLELSAVQLHGDEPPEIVAAVRARVRSGCEVWKAIRVRESIPLRRETGSDRLLLDAAATSQWGGTGRSFGWSLLDRYPERREIMLAGGLTPDNVAQAAALGTFGLDVSSGVEAAPGCKDPDRLRAFFEARRRIPGRGDDR